MYESHKKDIWRVFREHHYLSKDLNWACRVFLAYQDDVLIGFISTMSLPSGSFKNAFRVHRLVILPDYQGLGIGTALLEFIGEKYVNEGKRFFIRSSHIRLGRHWQNSPLWIATSTNKAKRTGANSKNSIYNGWFIDEDRRCYSYEYLGKKSLKKPLTLCIPYSMWIETPILRKDLKYLAEKYFLTIVTGESRDRSPIEVMCEPMGIRTMLYKVDGKIPKKWESLKVYDKWDSTTSEEIRAMY